MSFSPIPIRDNLVYFIGKQGCTWSCAITLNQAGVDPPTPIDLTENSIRCQIHKAFSDASPIAEFICSKVDDPAGKPNILLEAETTATLTACKSSVDSTNYESADRNGQYVYDVEIYKGTPEVVHRAIQGIIFVDAEVTK